MPEQLGLSVADIEFERMERRLKEQIQLLQQHVRDRTAQMQEEAERIQKLLDISLLNSSRFLRERVLDSSPLPEQREFTLTEGQLHPIGRLHPIIQGVKKPRVLTEGAIEKTIAAYCQVPDENGEPPLVSRRDLFEGVKELGLDCSNSRFSQILTEMETRGLIERRRESGVVELRMDRKFWMLRKHDFHHAGTVRSATKLHVQDRISWLVYPLAVSLAKDRSFAQVLDLSPEEIQEICEVGPLYAELIHEGVQDDDQLEIFSWYVRGGEGVKPTIAMGNETEMKIFQRIMWLVDSLASGLAFERKFVDVIDLSSEGIRAICGVDSKTAARIYELLRDEGQWVPQEVGMI